MTIVSESAISHYAKEVLSLEQAQGKLTKEQKGELQTIMQHLTDTNSEYLMGLKSATYSPGAVRAMKVLDIDPADVNGLDFLAPLTDVSSKGTGDLADALKDLDSIDLSVWRSRGVDADSVVDKYAAKCCKTKWWTVSSVTMPIIRFGRRCSSPLRMWPPLLPILTKNILPKQ